MTTRRITEEQKDLMRTWFTKAYIPCDEIAKRIGFSRQSVHLVLNKLGIDTRKRKVVTECAACGSIIEKQRSDFRKNDRHFCNPECYAKWARTPTAAEEAFAAKVMRDKCMAVLGYERCAYAGYHPLDDDVLIFNSRDEVLEWKRTGLPATAFSLRLYAEVSATYRGGIVYYAGKEGVEGDQGSDGGDRAPAGTAGNDGGRKGRNRRRRAGSAGDAD